MRGYTVQHPMFFGKPKETLDDENRFTSTYGLCYDTPKKKFRMAVRIAINKKEINEPFVSLELQRKNENDGYFDDENPIFIMFRIHPDRTYNGVAGTIDQIISKFNELCPQIAKGVIRESKC